MRRESSWRARPWLFCAFLVLAFPALCSERVMRQASSVGREELVALGTCFGKFTKSRKFHLKVTCMDYLAQHAKVSHLKPWQ